MLDRVGAPYMLSAMRIDPHRLLRLGELIRQGSFKRAADKLAVTQPALSQSIAQMEAEVGVRLIERTPHGVVPTVYGEALAQHAHTIELELKEAEARILELAFGQRRKLAIGGLSGGPVTLSTIAICKLREEIPELDTQLVEEHWSSALLTLVEDRVIDLAICHHLDDLPLENKKAIPFFRAQRVLCVRKGHPAERDLTLEALAGFPFACPNGDMGWLQEIDQIFSAAGLAFPRQQVLASNSIAVAKQIVLNSDAFALVSDTTVITEASMGLFTLAPIPSSPKDYWNYLIMREDHLPGRLMSAFIKGLADTCDDLGIPLHPDARKMIAQAATRRAAEPG